MERRKGAPASKGIPYRTLIILSLAALTLLAYWQVQFHEFINYDDPGYVTANRHVQAGLSVHGLYWAATTMELSNWHPLTWLSHMADVSLFRLNPAGHHWTNLIFHVFNVILLFFMLDRFTGQPWQSAVVAALFAVHPLNVESVAWISERKNVLSTLFWVLTILAYGYYALRPHWTRYVLVLAVFALGLMAKPMLVTLPFVLLLLDVWPLERMRLLSRGGEDQIHSDRWRLRDRGRAAFSNLLVEKAPLFAMSLLSSYMTLKASTGQALATADILPMAARIQNALMSYVLYIGKLIWPERLAVFYPYVHSWQAWQWSAAALLLAGMTAVAIRNVKRRPYLAVGWFWYLGTLVPVIGLVQVGMQAMADRYMYVPMIGLLIAAAWGIPELLRGRRFAAPIGIACAIIVVVLTTFTYYQLQHWQNSIRLFEHAVSVTSANHVAHNMLGNALRDAGRLEEAAGNYERAIAIHSGYWSAYNNLGVTRSLQKRHAEAEALYRRAIDIKGDDGLLHYNLGEALMQSGRIEESVFHHRQAVTYSPDAAAFHNSLGVALIRMGHYEESISSFREAIRLEPRHAGAHHNLAMMLVHQGQTREAVMHFSEALRIRPDYEEARRNLQGLLQIRRSSPPKDE